jgi:hypothetical protein
VMFPGVEVQVVGGVAVSPGGVARALLVRHCDACAFLALCRVAGFLLAVRRMRCALATDRWYGAS